MSNQNKQLIDIVQNYLRRERYHVNDKDFSLQLRSNQSFPSVKSITDTFDYFGISNVAVRVPHDALSQLPRFFLAAMNYGQNAIVAVTQTQSGLKIFKSDGSSESLSQDSFVEQWDGTVIAIENEVATKASWNWNKSLPLALCAFATIAAISQALLANDWAWAIMSLLCCCGLVISYFLVQEDLGVHSEITAKLCNSDNASTSCTDVVKSDAGSLLKGLNLSDLSVTFFAATLLILAISGYQSDFFLLLAMASVPMIAYSIYIQAFQLKKWCPLCLAIAATLLGMLATALIPALPLSLSLPPTAYLIQALSIFALAFTGWKLLKSVIKNALTADELSIDFMRFKRTPSLFTDLLGKGKIKQFEKLDENACLTFGNRDALIEVYTATNPLCGHCNDTFKVFDQLLNTHGKDFKLNIVFSVSTTEPDSEATQIARRILEYYKTDTRMAYAALKAWYENKDAEVWQSRHGKAETEASFKMMELSKEWCRASDIPGTPSTIINGCHYPEEYDIEDLLYLMGDLVEMAKESETNKEASLAMV